MIFNKELGITEEDIINQDKIEILTEWQISLNTQLTSILDGADNWHLLPAKKRKLYQCTFSLSQAIRHKIHQYNLKLKEEGKWVSNRDRRRERTLSMYFINVAKRELEKEEYKRLLEMAKAEMTKVDLP